ncbi:MAG: ABC transporter substrate-binding protein [Candidatus Brocadiia bacterium]
MKITKKIVLGILVLTVILAGCKKPESSGQEKATLRVVALPYLSFAPIHIAREEGFFEEEGLEVELVHVKRSSHALPALARGKLDVAAGSISLGIFNAIDSNLEIRLVADKGNMSTEALPYLALLVRDDLAGGDLGEKLKKIKPLRISAPPDTNGIWFTHRSLKKLGVNVNDVRFVYIHPSSGIDALKSRKIDGLMTGEPWIARARRAGGSIIACRDYETMPGYQYATILFGPRLVRDEPELGRRFMIAYMKGIRLYNEGKTKRNLKVLERATGLDQELLKEAGWPFIRNDASINVESIQNFQAWAHKRGLLTRVLKSEEYLDTQFVEYAREKLESPELQKRRKHE